MFFTVNLFSVHLNVACTFEYSYAKDTFDEISEKSHDLKVRMLIYNVR